MTSNEQAPQSHALGRRISAFGSSMSGLHFLLFSVVLISVAAVKAGMYFGHNFRSEALSDSSFRPEGLALLLDVSLAVGVALGIKTRVLFEIFSLGLTLLILGAMCYLLRSRLGDRPARVAALFLVVGPIGAMMFRHFGRYDMFFFIGVIFLVFSWRKPWPIAVIASLIMAVGNPGQAVATSISLLVLTASVRFRPWRRISVIGVVVSAVWLIAATAIGNAYGAESQLGALPLYATKSLGFFLTSLPLAAFSVYGISWILVAYLFLSSRRRDWLYLSVSFLLFPFGWMALTLDGTRVGVGVSALPVIAATASIAPQWVRWMKRVDWNLTFGVLILLVVLVPVFEVSWGEVRIPWEWSINELAFWWEVLRR